MLAPKTINEEVGFLLRLLPVAHAGAIRAQLKQQKKLKLKVPKRVGKAYTEEEKAALVANAKAAKRSKGIYFATMLAQYSALRGKEIRTLQWERLNLDKRIITLGETKSDAGTGPTIPINDELFSAAVEYAKWYTERFSKPKYKEKFGTCRPEWYVFPFGKAWPKDPTRAQTSLKTAWRNVRKKAEVTGRWHDNRHTFVTDLAETGASDQMIQDLAGYVSRDMVKHHSHMRTEAKRRAVGALVKPTAKSPTAVEPQASQNSDAVVQDSVQGGAIN